MQWFESWVEVINSLYAPNYAASAAQTNAYEKVCTGVYQHTADEKKFYIRGFIMSSKEIRPAINISNPSINPRVIAKNKIKYGMELQSGKFRTFHLRSDETVIAINGKTINVAITDEKVSEVIAVNTAKKEQKESKRIARLAKEKEKALAKKK